MNLFDQFHSLYREKERVAWPLCHVAARIVGKYERGVTQELADKEGINTSTVEHYAHASNCYRLMCHNRYYTEMREHLTISHFAGAWEAFDLKHHPERAKDVEEVMLRAIDPPDGRTKWSVADIRQAAKDNYGIDNRDMSTRWINKLFEIAEQRLPREKRVRAIQILRELRDLMKG